MKKNFCAEKCIVAIFATAGLIAAGCAKMENGGTIDVPPATGSIFDFTTRTVSTLVVQYDVPKGYQVYFEVYAEDPLYVTEDGQIMKKEIEPIDAGFTDQSGRYSERISVMSSTERIYIYSPYAGVPSILTADVNAGGITEASLPVAPAQRSATRAEDYENYNKMNGEQLHVLGIWRNANSYMLNGTSYKQYGRPDYVLNEKISVSADLLNLISQTLPEGTGVNPELIKNGNINIVEETTIDLFLIDEVTGALNALAYFSYDTNNPPTSKEAIKDITVAFPNVQVFKNHTLVPDGLRGNTGAVETGEGVRLHYWKDGKDMGEKFPANTSIGWVLYNRAYQSAAWGNAMATGIYARAFSDAGFNLDRKARTALFRSGDMVILGYEDGVAGSDYDYNDMALYIKANPMEAIIPGIPDVEPEEPNDDEVAAETTFRGILTFEDLWPYRGDFDMNDVVVSYESTVGYNKKNEVLQTKDKFTVMHSGAQIDNSFAYQMDVMRSDADITVSSSLGGNGGAYVDSSLDKATVRLANGVMAYANLPTKAVFDVLAKFKGTRVSKSDFTNPPYRPFITTTSKELEVHLTNQQPTEAMNKSLLATGHDRSEPSRNLYCVTFDEQGVQMPFAIDIVFDNVEDMSKFVVTGEKKRIDTHYPGFLNWVKTNGKENKDWYLNPKK